MAAKYSQSEEINKLACVIRDDGNYGGWRTQLLAEEITGKIETKFLLCNDCRGVLRDACLFEKEGKQEFRCSVCLPTGVNKQMALINRETVEERQAYCPLKSKGCDWTDELGKLLRHLEECEVFPVTCPLGCRDFIGSLQIKVVCLEKEIEELRKKNLEFQSTLTTVSRIVLRGDLEWEISGVENKISQKRNMYSEPFYVGMYKFQANIKSKDNHIGLFLHIIRGDWDGTLKWPIKYKYSIVLINQLDGKDNYELNHEITEGSLKQFPEQLSKPSPEKNGGLGIANFISRADLSQIKYSKNDIIKLRLLIEIT